MTMGDDEYGNNHIYKDHDDVDGAGKNEGKHDDGDDGDDSDDGGQ